jgi:hypothetical protein
MVAPRGPTAQSQVVASQAVRQERDRQNNVAPVPGSRGNQMLPQPYVAPAAQARFPPRIPGLTNQQSHSTPRPAPVPQPDPATTKPDPAHAKVDNPEVPTEQKPSVPSGPPLTVPQTPASSSSSDPPPPVPSSSAPAPPSSSARGIPTSSIVAIVLACIVGLIMILMTGFYFYDQKSTGDQRRIRNAQRRY